MNDQFKKIILDNILQQYEEYNRLAKELERLAIINRRKEKINKIKKCQKNMKEIS